MLYTAEKTGVVLLEILMEWLSVYRKTFHENNCSIAVKKNKAYYNQNWGKPKRFYRYRKFPWLRVTTCNKRDLNCSKYKMAFRPPIFYRQAKV